MSKFNYTPINIDKLDKKSKAFLWSIDVMVDKAPSIKKVMVDYSRFQLLRQTMSKESQEFYKYEIPYKGLIIYSIDDRIDGAQGYVITEPNLYQ